jgi:hypothetical protein
MLGVLALFFLVVFDNEGGLAILWMAEFHMLDEEIVVGVGEVAKRAG